MDKIVKPDRWIPDYEKKYAKDRWKTDIDLEDCVERDK